MAELEGEASAEELSVTATAEAYPLAAGGSAAPAVATGGGYAGPLATRQGEGMRPDVARAFDSLSAAASASGHALTVNSAYRSDAEQAALFAANPDPRMVARPGTSLHRCGTELDLGPPSAYGWLAQNAGRFGFTQRYSWEAWHYGYVRGPAPCSASGDAVAQEAEGGDGASSEAALPAFVPARFREAIARASSRWNVPGNLLAAQLLAESNFNPLAVSPAGASGIAQFMPGTAASYGLRDPFDPDAAIDAQAHLMADLLGQFGDVSLALAAYNAGPAPVTACSCVPPYAETQAYVARILGLMGGAGAIAPPALEVRLVGNSLRMMELPVTITGIEGMQELIGQPIGPTEWRDITQADIDAFADLSGDDQWIHVDVERAKTESPFGTTIAHGNLTLALTDGFRMQLIKVEGVKLGVNMGWNKVRFPAPVPAGSRVRATAELISVDKLDGGWYQSVTKFTIEGEGQEKPVCVAESVGRALAD